MGRDVYTYIKDRTGKIVWSSIELEGQDCDHEDTFFCGRNDETSIIATRANDETGELDITDKDTFDYIISLLQECQDKSDAEWHRLDSRADALTECRAKAINLAIFEEFDQALRDTYNIMKCEYWNRGMDMINLMRRTRELAKEFAYNANGFCDDWDLGGYTLYWRNDE